jgi:hypothetical protein
MVRDLKMLKCSLIRGVLTDWRARYLPDPQFIEPGLFKLLAHRSRPVLESLIAVYLIASGKA